MKFIGKIIFHIFSNALALFIAAQVIQGFVLQGDVAALFLAALILTVINALLKPLLKLVLGPVIFLTLGIFIIVINAFSLYVLDMLSPAITIQGYIPLLLATLIIGAVNIIVGFSAKATHE